MKIPRLLFLLLIPLFLSCNLQSDYKIVKKSNEIRSQFNNWKTNSVARDEIKISIQSFLDSKVGSNFTLIDDLPFTIWALSENILHLTFTDEDNKIFVYIDMLKVPKDVILSLHVGQVVYIGGTLVSYSEHYTGTISTSDDLLKWELFMNYDSIRTLR